MSRRLLLIAALSACLAGCSQPGETAWPRLDAPRRLVIAHRGAHARAAENSLGSIREAVRLGVDMVELDVRTTRDGALVLMHDESVDRTTDGSGEVACLDAREIRRLRLLSPDRAFEGESVPFLEDALAFAENVGIYLHVKEADPRAIARALAGAGGSVLVFSEDARWLRGLHDVAPALPLLPNASGADSVSRFARDLEARDYGCDEGDLSPRLAGTVHRLGGRILVDVLGRTSEASLARVLALGADGIQTDEPERVLRLLGRARGS